jgi:hypothetical protein
MHCNVVWCILQYQQGIKLFKPCIKMALSYFSIECLNENFNYASDFDDCKVIKWM